MRWWLTLALVGCAADPEQAFDDALGEVQTVPGPVEGPPPPTFGLRLVAHVAPDVFFRGTLEQRVRGPSGALTCLVTWSVVETHPLPRASWCPTCDWGFEILRSGMVDELMRNAGRSSHCPVQATVAEVIEHDAASGEVRVQGPSGRWRTYDHADYDAATGRLRALVLR